MSDNHNKFLSALRGLEEVRTPLSAETPISTGATQESQQRINLQKMTPLELAEYWNGSPLSEEQD